DDWRGFHEGCTGDRFGWRWLGPELMVDRTDRTDRTDISDPSDLFDLSDRESLTLCLALALALALRRSPQTITSPFASRICSSAERFAAIAPIISDNLGRSVSPKHV